MEIRIEKDKAKGNAAPTKLYAPEREKADKGGDANGAAEKPRPIERTQTVVRSATKIALVFCAFAFATMILFTLFGYERIKRAEKAIYTLNSDIDDVKLEISALAVQIECAVSVQDAQEAATERFGMQYPTQSQYVRIGSALPAGMQTILPATTEPDPTTDPGDGE